MAGRISGITIEIGGDTTKLQTALKGVDNQLRSTQSNLKDINKLLKLDPKNTELLTQKQKNLQNAVEQTKNRLNQLKAAQSQVAQGSAEWDALQREIIATEQQLKSLEGELRTFGSVGAQQIAAAGQSMQDFGAKCQDAASKFAPISAAAGALAGALVGLGINSVQTADDLNTLSKQTGLSTDTLQQMQYAADLIDVPLDNITSAVTRMKKNMGGSPEAFEELGVSVTDAEGNMRDAEDVFFETVQALSEVENGTERDQKAYEIFGKSADELAGIIDDGGEALKEYGKKAEDLGLILSGDVLNALNQTNDAIDESKAKLKAAAMELGGTIATGLAPVIEQLSGIVESLIGWLQKLTPEQTNAILTIALVVAAIAPLLSIIGSLAIGIGAILKLAPMLVAAFSLLFSPIGAVIAIIAALIAVGVLLYKNWDTIKEWAVTTWTNIVTTIQTAVANLKAAISEFAASAKQSISETWNNIKTTFNEAIQNIVDTFTNWVNTLLQKAAEFVQIGERVVESIQQGISNAWGRLTAWFENLWNKLFGNRSVNVNVNATGTPGTAAATGLDYVPYNKFPAILHRGEAVLTAGEAQRWREGGTGGIDYNKLAAAIAERPVVIQGDTARIFKVVRQTNITRTRATNYNALAMG